MDNFINEVVVSLGTSGVLTGLLIWLSKSWVSERLKNAIKLEYDQKLETHKAELKALNDIEIEKLKSGLKSESDVEIEKLKSQLQIESTKSNVKFQQLHSKRAEVIAQVYSLLVEFYDAMQDYVKVFEPDGGDTRKERRERVINSITAFREYFFKELIFLPKKVADDIKKLDKDLVHSYHEFLFNVDMRSGAEDRNKWIEVSSRIDDEIQGVMAELELEFRTLLGEESNT